MILEKVVMDTDTPPEVGGRSLPISDRSRTQASNAKAPALERSDDFAAFYSEHFKKVLNATFAFNGRYEDALDATQEAFGKALARWRRLGGTNWAEGWVMTTAFNLCRRKMFRAKRESALGPLANPPMTKEIADDATHRVDLVRAMKRLPRRRREAAILFYIGDLPISAVAESMHLTEGAVKRHLSLARTQLKEEMKGNHEEGEW